MAAEEEEQSSTTSAPENSNIDNDTPTRATTTIKPTFSKDMGEDNDQDPSTCRLRRGDLVRISKNAARHSKRLNGREGALGRITNISEDSNDGTFVYDLDWMLGGKIQHVRRQELVKTTAETEGMTEVAEETGNRGVNRRKRKQPTSFADECNAEEKKKQEAKKKKKEAAKKATTKANSSKQSSKPSAAAATAKNGNKSATSNNSSATTKGKTKSSGGAKSGGATPTKTVSKKSSKASSKTASRKPASKDGGAAKSGAAKKNGKKDSSAAAAGTSGTKAKAAPRKAGVKRRASHESKGDGSNGKKRKGVEETPETEATVDEESAPATATGNAASDLFDRQQREFERCLTRLEKVDLYGFFLDDAPPEFEENYGSTETTPGQQNDGDDDTSQSTQAPEVAENAPLTPAIATSSTGVTSFPSFAPYNWQMIRRRMEAGRYLMDREEQEEEERFQLFEPYYQSLEKSKRPKRRRNQKDAGVNPRVVCKQGINWDAFRDDVLAMCNASFERHETNEEESPVKGTLSYAVKKIRETVLQSHERTGKRHDADMRLADDRHKFASAIEKSSNAEAAMQSWRKTPFPERRYERLSKDVVCAGLSSLDERIAQYELRTNLPDSFVGLSYRYDDTGQSEAWMKSVVDEAAAGKSKKGSPSSKREARARKAAQAMESDNGVIRAQVNATMQSLLMGVQDRVMTELDVLHEPELTSANWMCSPVEAAASPMEGVGEAAAGQLTAEKPLPSPLKHVAPTAELDPEGNAGSASNEKDGPLPMPCAPRELPSAPDIVEQPVWGVDCYTRRNISLCLQTEFDAETAVTFIEKWLLPAINACPAETAHDLGNAAKILQGQLDEGGHTSHDSETKDDTLQSEGSGSSGLNHQAPLRRALQKKIAELGPPWLKPAANQLYRARQALGLNFFRVHPKGHGSVVLAPTVKPNTLVTFYRGELYPSWRWAEKLDAIDITQKRKDLKPALPDFYNMALERPQRDPRGYGLLFVDASRKAGHGSSVSHSCAPTCEVRVAALNGELCLAMTTIRELEMGEELTFDYNAVTESLVEYSSAVCLCGYSNCRGSFLHFATADCYQQVLNRNAPIATRFSNIVKGCMKRVMAEDDERVLRSHGFGTAAFGAISVNRRQQKQDSSIKSIDTEGSQHLSDSLDIVPIWLRTFVADTLRYIEYERRALPIALLCDPLSSKKKAAVKKSAAGARGKDDGPGGKRKTDEALGNSTEHADGPKEPKRVSAFFYFARTQNDFLFGVLKGEGFPEEITGIQRQQAIQKVAASYWQVLTEEKKQEWKDRAQAEFEGKKKAWVAAAKKAKKESTAVAPKLAEGDGNSNGPSEVPDGDTDAPKISFQDADSEGISAMEQRIQQLTMTLSRVGRVLDRHREASFEDAEAETYDAESLRKRVHSPILVARDEQVIGWMWNSEEGICKALLREVAKARCTRASLAPKLSAIRSRYPELDSFGDPAANACGEPTVSSQEGRRLLREALFHLRLALLDEIKEMAKAFRQHKSALRAALQDAKEKEKEANEKASSGQSLAKNADDSSNEDDDDTITEASSTRPTEDGSDTESSTAEAKRNDTCAKAVVVSILDDILEDVSNQVSEAASSAARLDSAASATWLQHYDERFLLLVAADVLLMYGNTSNFFLMKPFAPLKSTPIEVYARELGNAVPESAKDTEAGEEKHATVEHQRSSEDTKPHAKCANQASGSKSSKAPVKLCQRDDIITNVSVSYNGDYVLSQLLSWYNGGTGNISGLPDLFGCVLLPSMASCWSSDLLEKNKLKAERKTVYETQIRHSLVEWFQDPYQRGNPWSDEIRSAFTNAQAEKALKGDTSQVWLPFGSPILDFLVTGEEKNITEILNELDADDKVAANADNAELLTVDKGRPAQAVSNWIQCDKCLKWRKIPWHVDLDVLPEKFYCKDNEWDENANSCDYPEEDWDGDDKLVGNDGKVEGSPVKKDRNAILSPLEESNFYVGARFDVKRPGKEKFTIGTVTKTDLSGKIKRVMFHFQKTRPEADAWIEFGSPSIAPLFSITGKAGKASDDSSEQPTPTALFPKDKSNGKSTASGTKSKAKGNQQSPTSGAALDSEKPASPYKACDFYVGARFDVLRSDKNKYAVGIVKELDFAGEVKKVKFHLRKLKVQKDEWIEIGSSRIVPLGSRTKQKKKEKANLNPSVGDGKKPINLAAMNRPLREIDFVVGAKFDVLRSGKTEFTIGTVTEVDTSCRPIKIKFHYRKTMANRDEFIEFGSARIAQLHTHTEMRQPKQRGSISSVVDTLQGAANGITTTARPIAPLAASHEERQWHRPEGHAREDEEPEVVKDAETEDKPLSPREEQNFYAGARFDVLRPGSTCFAVGTVCEVDQPGDVRRVEFGFQDGTDRVWIAFGSPRIAPLYSKVEKKERSVAPSHDMKVESAPIPPPSTVAHQPLRPVVNGNGITEVYHPVSGNVVKLYPQDSRFANNTDDEEGGGEEMSDDRDADSDGDPRYQQPSSHPFGAVSADTTKTDPQSKLRSTGYAVQEQGHVNAVGDSAFAFRDPRQVDRPAANAEACATLNSFVAAIRRQSRQEQQQHEAAQTGQGIVQVQQQAAAHGFQSIASKAARAPFGHGSQVQHSYGSSSLPHGASTNSSFASRFDPQPSPDATGTSAAYSHPVAAPRLGGLGYHSQGVRGSGNSSVFMHASQGLPHRPQPGPTEFGGHHPAAAQPSAAGLLGRNLEQLIAASTEASSLLHRQGGQLAATNASGLSFHHTQHQHPQQVARPAWHPRPQPPSASNGGMQSLEMLFASRVDNGPAMVKQDGRHPFLR